MSTIVFFCDKSEITFGSLPIPTSSLLLSKDTACQAWPCGSGKAPPRSLVKSWVELSGTWYLWLLCMPDCYACQYVPDMISMVFVIVRHASPVLCHALEGNPSTLSCNACVHLSVGQQMLTSDVVQFQWNIRGRVYYTQHSIGRSGPLQHRYQCLSTWQWMLVFSVWSPDDKISTEPSTQSFGNPGHKTRFKKLTSCLLGPGNSKGCDHGEPQCKDQTLATC